MAKRKKVVKKNIDNKIFKLTAVKGKKINVDSSPMRGGIRL